MTESTKTIFRHRVIGPEKAADLAPIGPTPHQVRIEKGATNLRGKRFRQDWLAAEPSGADILNDSALSALSPNEDGLLLADMTLAQLDGAAPASQTMSTKAMVEGAAVVAVETAAVPLATAAGISPILAVGAGVGFVAAATSGGGGVPSASSVTPTQTTVITSVAITSASGIQNSTLNAGDVVSVTVTMSEATTVTGTPQLALNIGGTIVQANYVSGSGTTSLVFSYTILANQTDAHGISIDANALSLNSGTLTDAAGNAATLTSAAVTDNASFMVDTTAPEFNNSTTATTPANTLTSTTVFNAHATDNGSGLDVGITYSLGGANANLFNISTSGAVTFKSSPTTTGNYSFTVTSTDAAGNATTHTLSMTVGAGPLTTIVTAALSADTGSSSTDFVTNVAAQTISGTLSAALGSGETVNVSLDNGTTWAQATSTVGQSTWSLAGRTLTASNTLLVEVRDSNGFAGTQFTHPYVLDTTAPATPVINAVAGDDIVNAAEATAGFNLTGTGDVGATVVASFTSGRTLAGGNTVVAGAGGAWTMAITAADVTAFGEGAETITINQTDVAGNVNATAGTRTLTVDTVAPNTPVINAVAGDNKVNLSEASAGFTITGTGEVGATVVAGFTSGRTLTGGNSTVVAIDGTWSLAVAAADVTAFGEGSEIVTITQTDAAGNPRSNTRVLTVDTVAPTPTLTSTGNLLVTSSASVKSSELGTVYLVDSTLTVNSQADILALADSQYNSATITAANTATPLVLAGLASVTYKLYAFDAAGNLSAGTGNTIGVVPAVNLSAVAAGTGGFVINGQAASDASGYSVSNAGDVNGDGLADLIVGAKGANTSAGKSYVVFGQTGTTAVDLSAVAAGSGGFVINGQAANDFSGWSVSTAGDVNGDGLTDLIVSAKGANTSTGKTYVVFGQTNTTAIDLSAVAAGTGGFVLNGEASGNQSGWSVSTAGDVNGDGLADLIVGAIGASVNSGKSYVVFGQTSTTAINLSAIAAGTGGFVINGQTTNDYSGYSVSNAGDVNGDGLADLIVGAEGANTVTGKSYVVFGQTGTTAINLSALAGGFVINGEAVGNTSGYSVSNAGDVNGDGLADLIVGAPVASKSYVVFGQTGNTSINLAAVAAGTGGFVINAEGLGSKNGASVSAAGDLNGDGLADLIVGAPSTGSSPGKTYVVFGQTGTTAINYTDLTAGLGGFVIFGASNSDLSGQSVSAAGDVNGDGFADLIVGAQAATAGGLAGAGKSYVIFGGTQFVSALNPVDFIGTTGAETQTGTSAAETFMAGEGDDTLIGNGGADVMNGGKGNDTFVLNASNLTALTSAMSAGGNTLQLARLDGGTGFDTLQLAAGTTTLDLTQVSNVDAMSGSGTSRLNSIERIDMATDTGVNTLTLKAQDVNDMAGMNLIHLGAGSADGNTWTNVSGTALSATTQFHQVVVDGGNNDVVNLKTGGTWTNAGTANNGSSNYVVWQNTSTHSQVLVKSGVTVNGNVAPVVLDLNGDGQLSYSHTLMDVNGDGHLDNTAWAGPQDGVLVWDKYHDGQVHDASQYAFTQYGGDTDLKGLAAGFDTNHDGALNAQDAQFNAFKVWQDINQDGVSDAGEVRSLADWGVTSLHLVSDGVQRTPAAGVTEAGRTTASTTTGTAMLVADAAFDFSSVIAQHGDKAPVEALGTGSKVLTIHLQDVLQGATSPSHSDEVYSGESYSAATAGVMGGGGMAQLMLDHQLIRI